MILALPLVPLLAAGLLIPLRERPRPLGAIAVGALTLALALGVWAAAAEPAVAWRWSPAIEVRLAVEGFSRIMVVLVPAIAAPVVAFAAATEHAGRLRLLALMLGFVSAMLLLVIAADLLSLLIAWELVGATSWALIGHDWRDPEKPRAAAMAFLTTRSGDLGLYVAAGVTFAATGSFAFSALGEATGPALNIIAAGVLLAAAAKSAQIPFSPWLFAAMAGPTPVSALLHSATMVAAGAYLLVRVAPALEAASWFLPTVTAVGLTTAIGAGLVALVQPQAKRVLAASTSAQYGLMFVAVGVGSTAAAGAHLVAHAAFKSLLFLGAGVAIHAAGSTDLGAMRLGRVLPRVAALSAVGALALAAVPPLGGAWTKAQIVAAAAETSPWLAAAALAAGVLSTLYATRYQLLAYGPRSSVRGTDRWWQPTDRRIHHRPGSVALGSIAVLAIITVLLSALWIPGADGLVEAATAGSLPGVTVGEVLTSLVLIAVVFALAWSLLRHDRLLELRVPPALRAALVGWLGLSLATQAAVVEPVSVLSRRLAAFDDRVIDAGVRATGRIAALVSRISWRQGEWTFDGVVRAAARVAALVSRISSRHGEWTMDGVVRTVAAGTVRLAAGSRVTDDGALDAAVEGGARLTGVAGRVSQRLQTGLTHHYYVIVVAGMASVLMALVLRR